MLLDVIGCCVFAPFLLVKCVFCSLTHAAGIEDLYSFIDHLFGIPGKTSGISMNINHFGTTINEQIKCRYPGVVGWFTNNHNRVFIQSGVACWAMSFAKDSQKPCCDHKIIGGDGTTIGIPKKNLSQTIPVWVPPEGIAYSSVCFVFNTSRPRRITNILASR